MVTELTPRETVRDFLQQFPGLEFVLPQLLGTHEQRSLARLRIPPVEISIALGGSSEFSPDGRRPSTRILRLADIVSARGPEDMAPGTRTAFMDLQRALIHLVQSDQGSVGRVGRSEVTFAVKHRHPETIGLTVEEAHKRWGSLSRAWHNDRLHPGFFGLVVRYIGDEEETRGQQVQQLRLDSISSLIHGPTRLFSKQMSAYRETMREEKREAQKMGYSNKVITQVPNWHDLSAYLRAEEAGLRFQTVQLSSENQPIEYTEHQNPYFRTLVTEADSVDGTPMVRIEFQPTRPPAGVLRLDPSPVIMTIPSRTRSS